MKRLVLCCDGTWNSADQERNGVPCPTNVLRIAYRVAKRDGQVPQVIYYDQGVGTGNVVDRYSGGALGKGLEDNIHDAYRFLMANYEPDDELFLFGFSRGAFTARSIVGMIRKCGILGRTAVTHYRDAVDLYRNADHPDDGGPTRFRRDYSIAGTSQIKVKFIGVWDTVGALGIPLAGLRWMTRDEYQFHDAELSGDVEYAYHALAIDEHRSPFEPTLWKYKPKAGQTVEQVWFCGAHSDAGGGYAEKGLANITLAWMLDMARGAGLALDRQAMNAYPLDLDPLGELHNSKTGAYRLTPGIDRLIGLEAPDPKEPDNPTRRPDPTQSVHSSVMDRWDKDATYRPSALRDYFQRIGDPRASQP
jgi:uncharacterized protein (DUF2235 family)